MVSRATPKRQSSVDESMLQSQLLGLSLSEEELNALVRQDKSKEFFFFFGRPQFHVAFYSFPLYSVSLDIVSVAYGAYSAERISPSEVPKSVVQRHHQLMERLLGGCLQGILALLPGRQWRYQSSLFPQVLFRFDEQDSKCDTG